MQPCSRYDPPAPQTRDILRAAGHFIRISLHDCARYGPGDHTSARLEVVLPSRLAPIVSFPRSAHPPSTTATSNISTVRPYGSLYSPRPGTARNLHPSRSAVCLTFSSRSVTSSYPPLRCACTSFSSQALEATHTDGQTTALPSSISLQASRSWSSLPCRRGGRDQILSSPPGLRAGGASAVLCFLQGASELDLSR